MHELRIREQELLVKVKMLEAELEKTKSHYKDFSSRMEIIYSETNKRMEQENKDLKIEKRLYLDKIEELSIQLRAFGDEIKLLRTQVGRAEIKDINPSESIKAELEAELKILSKFFL